MYKIRKKLLRIYEILFLIYVCEILIRKFEILYGKYEMPFVNIKYYFEIAKSFILHIPSYGLCIFTSNHKHKM